MNCNLAFFLIFIEMFYKMSEFNVQQQFFLITVPSILSTWRGMWRNASLLLLIHVSIWQVLTQQYRDY